MATAIHHQPGHTWRDRAGQRTVGALAAVFVPEPVLAALIAIEPMLGIAAIHTVFAGLRRGALADFKM